MISAHPQVVGEQLRAPKQLDYSWKQITKNSTDLPTETTSEAGLRPCSLQGLVQQWAPQPDPIAPYTQSTATSALRNCWDPCHPFGKADGVVEGSLPNHPSRLSRADIELQWDLNHIESTVTLHVSIRDNCIMAGCGGHRFISSEKRSKTRRENPNRSKTAAQALISMGLRRQLWVRQTQNRGLLLRCKMSHAKNGKKGKSSDGTNEFDDVRQLKKNCRETDEASRKESQAIHGAVAQ